MLQAKEAREASEACATAAAAARAEADAAAKEGAAAGRDFASRVGGLTAAAAAARDALAGMFEAEEGGRAAAEELQGILGELGNATKVRSSMCVLNSGLTYVLSTDCIALFWLCRLSATLRSSWQCLCRTPSGTNISCCCTCANVMSRSVQHCNSRCDASFMAMRV